MPSQSIGPSQLYLGCSSHSRPPVVSLVVAPSLVVGEPVVAGPVVWDVALVVLASVVSGGALVVDPSVLVVPGAPVLVLVLPAVVELVLASVSPSLSLTAVVELAGPPLHASASVDARRMPASRSRLAEPAGLRVFVAKSMQRV